MRRREKEFEERMEKREKEFNERMEKKERQLKKRKTETTNIVKSKKKKVEQQNLQYRNTLTDKPLCNYTTQNLLRITFSFNDLMLKTNRLKKDFFYKDRLIFGLDDPVANMSIRHVYYA